MIRSIALWVAFVVTMLGMLGIVGYGPVYSVMYLAITIWAYFIAATFAFLYYRQRTKLALGMFWSWAGTGSIQGWWWLYNYMGAPEWMVNNPMLFAGIACYATGAVIHFQSFRNATEIPNRIWEWPAVIGLGVSLLVYWNDF